MTSVTSFFMCRIEAFQSQARILGGELLIHPDLDAVTRGLPGSGLTGKDIHAVDAPIQALMAHIRHPPDAESSIVVRSLLTCASVNSQTSRGTSVHSAAQFLKLDRKPCGNAAEITSPAGLSSRCSPAPRHHALLTPTMRLAHTRH